MCHLLTLLLRGDDLGAAVQGQWRGHQPDPFLGHGLQAVLQHAHQHHVVRVHVHYRHHVGPVLVEARVDLYLTALQRVRRPVDPVALQVAHHHVFGPHARQHVHAIAATLDHEQVRVAWYAHAHVAQRCPHPHRQAALCQDAVADGRLDFGCFQGTPVRHSSLLPVALSGCSPTCSHNAAFVGRASAR